jgi:hypothetical protein
LLRFDDSPPNFPVGSGHNRIDITGGGRARRFEQFDDSGTDIVVIVWQDYLVGHRDSSILCPRI